MHGRSRIVAREEAQSSGINRANRRRREQREKLKHRMRIKTRTRLPTKSNFIKIMVKKETDIFQAQRMTILLINEKLDDFFTLKHENQLFIIIDKNPPLLLLSCFVLLCHLSLFCFVILSLLDVLSFDLFSTIPSETLKIYQRLSQYILSSRSHEEANN